MIKEREDDVYYTSGDYQVEHVVDTWYIWHANVKMMVRAKRKDGKLSDKKMLIELRNLRWDDVHVNGYYMYKEEDGGWYAVYRVNNKSGVKTLIWKEEQKYHIDAITNAISNGDIRYSDYRIFEQKTRIVNTRITSENKWSVEMDGKSILALLAIKPKMSYTEVVNIIHNEGGSIDKEGIIHKGSNNKVIELR